MLFRVLHPSFIKQFEDDARTQVKFHIFMAWIWAFTMLFTPFAFWPIEGNEFIQILILEVSLYANWATEIGALAAAQASLKADRRDSKDVVLAIE